MRISASNLALYLFLILISSVSSLLASSFSLTENSRVNVDPNLTHHLHLAGNNSNMGDCSIEGSDLNSANSKEITCWLDVEELDLYFHGVDLNLNVSESLCEYVVYKPFWFYAWPTGNTSDHLKVYNKEMDEEGSSLCTGMCNFIDEAGRLVKTSPCNELVGYPSSDSNGEVNFAFDHTSRGGPNCDGGSISISSYTFESTGGGNCQTLVEPSVSIIKSKPSFDKCWASPISPHNGLLGPSIIGSNYPIDNQGFPMSQISEAEDGFIQDYKYEGPMAFGLSTNLILANYTNKAGAGKQTSVPATPEYSSFGWPDAEQYYVPQRLIDYSVRGREVYNKNPSPGLANISGITRYHDPFWKMSEKNTTPNPFYEFICVNKAYESKGTIRLQIREMNEKFDVKDEVNYPLYKTHITKLTDDFMDNVGSGSSGASHPLNDFLDWDDMRFPMAPATIDLGVGSLVNGAFSTPVYSHPENGL